MNWIFDAYSNVYSTAMMGRSTGHRDVASAKGSAPVEASRPACAVRAART